MNNIHDEPDLNARVKGRKVQELSNVEIQAISAPGLILVKTVKKRECEAVLVGYPESMDGDEYIFRLSWLGKDREKIFRKTVKLNFPDDCLDMQVYEFHADPEVAIPEPGEAMVKNFPDRAWYLWNQGDKVRG